MKITITLYREDLKDRTLSLDDINSSAFNIPYDRWREADEIAFVDDDGRYLMLKEGYNPHKTKEKWQN